MIEIHCYNCGGFIGVPSRISHRLGPSIMHKEFGAIPTTSLCACNPPVVYGPRGGRSSLRSERRLN